MRLGCTKGEAGEVRMAGKDQIIIQLVHHVKETEPYHFILASIS